MPDTIPLSLMGKWTKHFLQQAEFTASLSKDPSTKCGAVITNGKRFVSMGFNGFPAGVPDALDLLGDREAKYEMVVHAEVNAILFAGRPVDGFTLYTWPFPPCSRCAAIIIQAGIKTVWAPVPVNNAALWHRHHCDRTIQMFGHAGVAINLVDITK